MVRKIEYTTLAVERELSEKIGRLAAKLGVSKVDVVRLGVALVEESVKNRGGHVFLLERPLPELAQIEIEVTVPLREVLEKGETLALTGLRISNALNAGSEL
ncbi:MAG: hypothetical protein ABC596_08320 [Candidatus Methanosuratincola petrocarbonis]